MVRVGPKIREGLAIMGRMAKMRPIQTSAAVVVVDRTGPVVSEKRKSVVLVSPPPLRGRK